MPDRADREGQKTDKGHDVINAVTGLPVNDAPLTAGEAEELARGGARRPDNRLGVRARE